MALKCKKWQKKYSKCPTFSIPRPSKIYPNWNYWFETIPSGNPALSIFSIYRVLGILNVKSYYRDVEKNLKNNL
jgi:hypothetical protein